MKSKKHLSFKNLRRELSSCFRNIPDHRQTQKVSHKLHDALMSGFACMYFQNPSLLQFQKKMQKKRNSNNLKTLFDVSSIPENTQLRDIIDRVDSERLGTFFDQYFYHVQRSKHLESFQLLPGIYLVAMDGTDYFSSTSVSCSRCLVTKHKKKSGDQKDEGAEEVTVRYAHKTLQVAILHPDKKQVIPLMPEEIHNTDGTTKQDCEINAAKRLIPKLRKIHPQLGMMVGGDDLFSRQPMIEKVRSERMHYLFVAKPTSHLYMMEWLAAYPELNGCEKKDLKTGDRHVYEWMNQVPLNGKKEAIFVNYLRYFLYRKDKKGREKVVYKNSWVTDIEVSKDNVKQLARGGRCRWKVENECFNTLKNQGYCIDHSYGHGQHNLSFNFYILTLIAFTFHQVFELTDKLYQACRKELGSKKNLWQHINAYLNIWIFETWEMLLNFTLNPENYIPEKAFD